MKVHIYQGKDRQYYLRLVASNGRTVLDSEGYRTRWNARRAAKRTAKLFNLLVEDE